MNVLTDGADLRELAALVSRVFRGAREVESIQVDPAGQLGSLSTLSRITVRFREEHESRAQTTLILKQEPRDQGALDVVALLDSLRREHGFFSSLPEVAEAVSLHCWLADYDPRGGRTWILLEDAGPQTLPTQREGCPVELAEEVVRQLARLHALTRGAQGRGYLDWCPTATGPVIARVAERYRRSWASFEERFEGLLPPDALDVARRFSDQMPTLLAEWGNHSELSIIHGDARLDNVVRRQDGSIRLIDWQMTSLGEGPFDLAHFIAGSLTSDDRRHHEGRLLDVYCSEMRDHGNTLSRQQLEDAVRRTTLLVLPLNVIFGIADAPSDPAAESRQAVLLRYFTAISEYSSGDFLRG